MTLRESLASRYVLLAEELSRRGHDDAALSCVLMIHRLGCGCQKARELLQAAADRPAEAKLLGSVGQAASLLAAKRKLDHRACVELSVAGNRVEDYVSGADISAGDSKAASGSVATAALMKEMQRLKGKMKRERGKAARRIARQMEQLLVRLRAGLVDMPVEEITDADRLRRGDDDDWGELSLEHEVHNIGNDFYKIGMFLEAIEAYSMALEIRPDLLESYFNRSLTRVRLGRYPEALEDMNRVLGLNDRLGEAWYTRGLIYEYMQEYDKAIADYRKALEVDPDYKRAADQIEVAQNKKPAAQGGTGMSESYRSGSREEGVIADFSVFLLKSTLRFGDVGGCEEAIRALKMAALYLAGDPLVEEFGGRVPAGILLWGPKGVGKTRCVQALAGEVGCRVYALPPTALMDMWAGNSEKNTRNLWAEAAAHEPSVIYIDELDGFLSKRTREAGGDGWYNKMITTVLHLMSQVSDRGARVLLVGATNRISAIDTAFLRPGRFDEVIYVGRPNVQALAGIWLIQLERAEQAARRIDFLSEELSRAVHFDRAEWMHLAMKPYAADGSGIPELARMCEQRRLTGADVVGVIRATIADRIYAKKELGIDLGPIGPSDLKTQLQAYESPQWRSRRGPSRGRCAE